ncbi:hypothetical protein [Actinoplanes sp. NPDC051411]|uniref:hypothetical protein n=1 Tax=Actinoplanes sp. NPDC051411 TaxID=3155522 RepID=UPI00342DE9EE
MPALIRYYLAATVHGQRYLAPLLFDLAVLSVFTINDAGPLIGSYVVSAASLLLTSCWLTVTIVNLEDPVRRAITLVAAGGAMRVLAAEAGLAVLAGGALIGVGTIFPIVSGSHTVTWDDVAAGILAQVTTTAVGIAVGLLCSRLVVPRPGYSLILALAVIVAVPLTPGLPPVHSMLRRMSSAGGSVPAGPLAADALIAAFVLLGAFAVTHRIAVRRD